MPQNMYGAVSCCTAMLMHTAHSWFGVLMLLDAVQTCCQLSPHPPFRPKILCLAVIMHGCSTRLCLSTCCVVDAQQRNNSSHIPSNPSIHAAAFSPHGHAVCSMHCCCLVIKPGLATLGMHCRGCSQYKTSAPATRQTLASC